MTKDVARTALRLGARQVVIVYRRSTAEMPARPQEAGKMREKKV